MSQRNFYLVGDASTIEAAHAVREKLLGNPKSGVAVGEGRHIAMPQSWDGTGETPPGWEKEYAPILQHPTDSLLRATLYDNVVQTARAGSGATRLTVQERNAVTANLADAAALDATWDGAVPASVATERIR